MKHLGEAIQVLENMGKAPPPPKPTYEAPPGMIHCACGKKFIPLGHVRIFNTKFVPGVIDTICRECYPDVKDLVPIVCVKCKAVVSRVQPYRFKSGFEFRKGESYHTNACPNCNKTIVSSVLLEKYFFEQENGIENRKLI